MRNAFVLIIVIGFLYGCATTSQVPVAPALPGGAGACYYGTSEMQRPNGELVTLATYGNTKSECEAAKPATRAAWAAQYAGT